jgi:choline oxidase
MHFDTIVVGGGTAGAVIARRLAEDPQRSVALLEAGPSDEGASEVLELRRWQELLGDARYGHDFAIAPQPRGNSAILHSRGVMLGGCSSHNSAIAFRPPDFDFARWQAQGATGWGPSGVDAYFDRVAEKVHFEPSDADNEVVNAFIAAAQEMGFAERDFGAEVGEGVGLFQLNKRAGLRASSSVAYLHPLSALPDNLTVLTETHVSRLRLEANRVTGVETSQGPLFTDEVVLAAGAFGSPHLLMLSGIGPAAHLRDHGIDVVCDLPAVGAHLQDHPEGVIIWEAAAPVPERTYNFYEAGLFATALPDAPWPDLMFHFGTQAFDLHTAALGYPSAANAFSLTPNVTRAKSEGSVRLASADPDEDPRIDFRYFTDPEGYDERIMVAGLKLARALAEQPALAKWVRRELAPGPEVTADEALSEYARRSANTVYHPVGTCRMGAADDPGTVVTPDLKVKGIENLLVADASIFPSVVSTNPCITCMMIGEKCADMLRSED